MKKIFFCLRRCVSLRSIGSRAQYNPLTLGIVIPGTGFCRVSILPVPGCSLHTNPNAQALITGKEVQVYSSEGVLS